MPRRQFLRLCSSVAATGLLSACGARPAAEPEQAAPAREARSPIRAICFDLFTLFDPRSVVEVAREVVSDGAVELCEAWRTRQFEYSWLRVAGQRYVDFEQVTEDALDFAARSRGVALSPQARRTLVAAYSRLSLWPDTRDALSAWKRAGLRLAPLANYSPSMLQALVAHAGLEDVFDALISTDRARTFKPDPRAYALGVSTLGLPRQAIAFAAFGGWDAAGAKWFGFPTFWVNRLGIEQEALAPGPDASGPTLAGLSTFVSSW